MEVYVKHGKVTQNMHGASRNYRYVWDVSHVTTKIMLVIIYLLEDEQELSLGMLIRPKRIYNFCLLHACFV